MSLLLKNAQKLRDMNARIHESFRMEPHSPAYKAAAKAFHDSYDSLAFPGGLNQAFERLRNKDLSIVDDAITFLNEDPRYFRSGYHKEKILKLLKSIELSKSQQSILAALILRSIDGGPKRIYSAYAKLARKINPALLLSEVRTRLDSTELEVKRRALHVYELISSENK